MKDDMVKDERVIAQTRKFQSEAWQILVLALFASVLVQQFFFKAPFSQFAVEFFCAMGACIYVEIRNLASGIGTAGAAKKSNKKILITSLIAGAAFVFTYTVLTGVNDIAEIAIVSLSFFSVFLLLLLQRRV